MPSEYITHAADYHSISQLLLVAYKVVATPLTAPITNNHRRLPLSPFSMLSLRIATNLSVPFHSIKIAYRYRAAAGWLRMWGCVTSKHYPSIASVDPTAPDACAQRICDQKCK